MNINIIKELQENFAVESFGENYETQEVDKYRNNPLGDIFAEMDNLECQQFALESLSEMVRGTICFHQDLAVADSENVEENFSIESIVSEKSKQYERAFTNKLEESFSTESLINKAKRAGYNVKIYGKELINKLLTWIKAIYDSFIVEDGKFKSYKKLLKTYREKLNMSTPSTKEDKEIKIRQTDYKTVLKTYIDAVPSDLASAVSEVKGADTVSKLVDALIKAVEDIIKELPEKIKSGVSLTGKTAEGIAELTNEKVLAENFKDFITELKDNEEAEEMSPAAAQSKLSTAAADVMNQITDKKYKKAVDNLIKASNTTLAKINKKKESPTDKDSVENSQKVAAIGTLLTQLRTAVLGPWTKYVKSSIQALLADMAKVINANTSIKGN